MAIRIQLRRDTAANWTANNPLLYPGEVGIETDTLKFKIGPTTATAWNSITSYANTVPSDLSNTLNDYILAADLGNPDGPAQLNIDGNLIVPKSSIIFEGATADSYETTLTVTDPTADRTLTLPNETGTVATQGYVDTAISSFQALPSQSGNNGKYLTTDGSSTSWGTIDLSSKQDVVSGVSSTEIGYLDGVTSGIQNQIDGKLSLSGGTMTGNLTLSGAPQSSLHAATKAYVDNITAGLNFHAAVHAATTADLSATYDNNAGTLSASGTFPQIDLHTVNQTERVLVKSQSSAVQNGIYTLTDDGSVSGTWTLTRASDADNSPAGEIAYGDFVFVQNGSANAGYGYIMTTTGTITLGSSNINWTQFSAGQVVTAGTGLTEPSSGTLAIDTTVTADLSTAQTLTNKTLTSPKINEDVAVTATATELNYVDGVTSSIQTQLDAKIPSSLVDAKGDILVGSADNTVTRLAAGTNGYLLTANSSATNGIEWAAAPVSLPSQTDNSGKYLTTNGSTASWASLPVSTASATISTNDATTIDTVALTSFYTIEYLLNIKQSTKIRTSKVVIQTDGTSVDLTEYGIVETGGSISGVTVSASVSSGNALLRLTITDAATTNAAVKIVKTSILNTSPIIEGGTLASDSTYYYRAFTSSDNLVISNFGLTADILVVSGGGNGGNEVSGYGPPAVGGGGGAGGVLYSSSQALSVGTYVATIGAGGGNASSFAKDSYVLSPNGGGAGGGVNSNGGDGGSGGGGGAGGYPGGVHTGTGIGNAGGDGQRAYASYNGGGGGGAGGAGRSATYYSADQGGIGTSDYDSFLAPFGLGEESGGVRYIAGGGAGKSRTSNYGWTGGLGGGGDFGGGNGDANTGGGGTAAGGLGGSGLIIVRYLKSAV